MYKTDKDGDRDDFVFLNSVWHLNTFAQMLALGNSY